jgi:hypothetical protein
MRRTVVSFGLLVVALALIFWALAPADPVRIGIMAGSATGFVNLMMLWLRRNTIVQASFVRAAVGLQVNFFARAAVLVLVLLILRRLVGTSGDIAFLGGFLLEEAVVLILSVKEQR